MSELLKNQFPALANNNVAYLDSASSCQIPQPVISAITDYMCQGHGNPDRGMYAFSENAESISKLCRKNAAKFLHCDSQHLIFTSGTTEAINQVANGLKSKVSANQSILVTQMEHHSNLLPWQKLCEQTGARLNVLTIHQNGELDLSRLEELLADDCYLFAFCHNSNVLGTTNPVNQLIEIAKSFKVKTLVDGAQAVAHHSVNLAELGCDYYVFSGHKLYAPSGIGMLYCRQPSSINPLLLGGGIVGKVTEQNYQLLDNINRFEAGSPNMLGIVGLNAAFEFIQTLDFDAIRAQQSSLVSLLSDSLDRDSYQIISHRDSCNMVSFWSQRFHSHDIATILADRQIAVRAGHHCAQPCLSALSIKHCVRISVGLYNTQQDINRLIDAMRQVDKVLA